MHRVGRGLSVLIAVAAAALGAGAASTERNVSPKELLPLAAWQKDFQIIEGSERGKIVPFVFQRDPADDKRWKFVLGDYARLTLRSGPGGALVMERLDLFKSKSYILYEPALPVLPADASPHGPVWRETIYRMYSLETGKLKRTGRATHGVNRVSRSEFATPAGVIEGYYVEIEHGMEMEYYSHLQLSLGLGCRFDEGPVYGTGRYKLRKLGVFTETKTATVALAKKIDARPAYALPPPG